MMTYQEAEVLVLKAETQHKNRLGDRIADYLNGFIYALYETERISSDVRDELFRYYVYPPL